MCSRTSSSAASREACNAAASAARSAGGVAVWRSAFHIATGLLAARSPSNDPRPAEGSTPPTDSVAEFLGLLADLSPQQRACVALRYVGEYTSPEIGELLGTSAGTVRVQLHRAHAALRHTIMEAEHA